MTDTFYYVVNYDGTPILHTVLGDSQADPIRFTSDDAAYYVRDWLRRELMHSYLQGGMDNADAEQEADARITVLKHRVGS